MSPTPTGPVLAPRSSRPLAATVRLPGSKSLSARHLVLAAQASEPSQISGLLRARDTELMLDALQVLGVGVRQLGDSSGPNLLVQIDPPPELAGPLPQNFINCGLAGTVMRFVPPLAALARGNFRFTGDAQAAARPLDTLFGALEALGVALERPARGSLPFSLRGSRDRGGIEGGKLEIDSAASSQFVSALLLVAPSFQRGLDLQLSGSVPSSPHLKMSVQALREHGAKVHELSLAGHPLAPGLSARRWRVEPGGLRGGKYTVEPDLSNAGVFLAAAGLAGGRVTVRDWPQQTTQAGDYWRELLAMLGFSLQLDAQGLSLSAPPSWPGLDLDLSDYGELVPTLCALLAFATGPSTLRGLGHLRGHETDRLEALTAELNRLGARARASRDTLYISPLPAPTHPDAAPNTGGEGEPVLLRSYADHRMATFAALVGLRRPVLIEDIGATSKTLPGFYQDWLQMLQGGPGEGGHV